MRRALWRNFNNETSSLEESYSMHDLPGAIFLYVRVSGEILLLVRIV